MPSKKKILTKKYEEISEKYADRLGSKVRRLMLSAPIRTAHIVSPCIVPDPFHNASGF